MRAMAADTLARTGDNFARATLLIDAGAVTGGALALMAYARPIARLLGREDPRELAALGAVLLPYAGMLAWSARRTPTGRGSVLTPAIVNAAWVGASVGVLASGRPVLPKGGRWAVALVAVAVGAIGAAQVVALRRQR